ncbi:Protein argonaute [Tolypocladium ophioglossoides CBS 100239]|uniref:Protein argonaute n=1 Tax=Tolypocladium ophioglossoides (strain CBS 100239) TaxID=1163406 RepID=A0A0L0ND49_TOLOC|nr:Protein argonaute [Tolypocladium ophioglossoides CBS 100239]
MSDRGRSPAPSGGGSGPSQRSSQSPHGSAGSRGSSPSRSVASAQGLAPSQGAAAGWKSGMGFDPAKPAKQANKGNTRMELPPDAYLADTEKSRFTLRGNKFNTEGKPAMVEVNQYRMKTFDFTKKIYQYDVTISPDSEKKQVVLKKLWVHETTKRALKQYNYPMWIFDGRKLAWAAVLVDRGELRFTVDLDDGKRPPGAPAREGNKFLVMIRQTTQINVSTLQLYLDQKVSFNIEVQEAMNFIDHLIRQFPSQQMLSLKRNFYDENERGKPLAGVNNVVEVHKGVYASVRLSHNLARGGIGLALNADVANTCFWGGRNTMDVIMLSFLASCDPKRWFGLTQVTVAQHLRPVQHHSGKWSSSDAFKQLRKLVRLKFKVHHAGRYEKDKIYSIRDFTFDQKYGAEGANAKTVTFEYNGKETCVGDYYAQKYKAWLKYSRLPLIDAGKGGYIPMEYAVIEPMQRYPFKLNPEQTAAMIKIAVTRPQVRRADIENKVAKLRHREDPFLREYGVSFEPSFTKTDAKILPPPKVDFGQGSGSADPRFSGRWDLRGKKFWKQNTAPLQNWAFIAMDTCVDFPNLQNFAKTFRQTFLGHGGKCPQDAMLLNVPANIKHDIAEAIVWAHGEVRRARGYTQLLFIVVGHRNSPHYIRLKKSADCRFGILSQVVNSDAVKRNNGQYHSNVCMKVNAKLGGATSRTMAPWRSQPTYFPKDRPTMIVGVDISHTAPGGNAPSVAAMTMSVDRDATRYAAMVETNGYRTEMLLPSNCHFLFGQLSKQWMAGHDNAFPKHVIYFRDGVSEGQFAQVIDQEIGEIKRYFRGAAPKMELPKFTVIVATKRHHIRVFPQNGDKNGNALPGTLVEKEVTHPFMWDFYLCSHVAIQGTARPVHYHVISDEMNVPVNDFQKMIYHQCYSYARSTTPVSLHPAVYYAHLAGNRARAHENVATSDGFRAGGKGHELIRDKVAKGQSVGTMPGKDDDSPPLLQLGGRPTGESGPVEGEMRQREFFRGTMWYI